MASRASFAPKMACTHHLCNYNPIRDQSAKTYDDYHKTHLPMFTYGLAIYEKTI